MTTQTFSLTIVDDGMQPELQRLAELDSQEPLTGPVLVGKMNGNIEAALQLSDSRAIANPFIATAQLITLLQAHRKQLLRSSTFVPQHKRTTKFAPNSGNLTV